MKFLKFIPLAKVDEATHSAYGIVTAETPDADGEIADYADTKAEYERWSQHFLKTTTDAGQDPSFGNIRLQHGLEIAGKANKVDFKDAEKEIWLGSEPRNDEMWKLLKGGFVTGYSHGGDYAYRNCNTCDRAIPQGNFCANCKKVVYVRYAPVLAEVSWVDNPNLERATFKMVKADGSSEMVKFQQGGIMAIAKGSTETPAQPAVEAAVGVTPEQLASMVKSAVTSVMATLKKDASRVILTPQELTAYVAKHVPAIIEKAAAAKGMHKDMYDVSRLSEILCSLAYIKMSTEYERAREGDDSALPEKLQQDLESLAGSFLAMAAEETKELVESAATAGKGSLSMAKETAELAKAARKSAADVVDNLKGAVDAHHDKVTKLHKAHADDMHAGLDKMKKILGAEEAGADDGADNGNEPAPINVQAEGTENLQHARRAADKPAVAAAVVAKAAPAGETFTMAQVQDIVDKTVQEVLKALGGPETVAVEKAAAAPGIGDRTQVPTVIAGAGPSVRVMPVTKAQDAGDGAAAAAADQPKIDVAKAMAGDTSEQLKLMKGVKAQSDVPATVAAALGTRR